jgi:hypothetical protein
MNATNALKSGDEMLTDAINTLVGLDWFSAEYWYKSGACDQWSIKDVIAHLTSFETLLTDVLISLEAGAITPDFALYIADPERFNHMQVSDRQDKSVGELLAEYEQAHALNQNWLPYIDGKKLYESGLVSWFGEEQSPADFIIYAAYDHKREHVDQIMSFIQHVAPQNEIMNRIPRPTNVPASPLGTAWNRISTFAKLMS